ncbi:hypothetical protein LRS13_13880 [Svornostia abyssi]|uniref:Uncharacterized protein n=1 Tax=Svornostia abyssi TaxID=2898438 RepID=A0ABY5PAW0_9ACTN|nr:hypothetical protein LRS13_13880 [Parviterribacteraceae bacterium J379]
MTELDSPVRLLGVHNPLVQHIQRLEQRLVQQAPLEGCGDSVRGLDAFQESKRLVQRIEDPFGALGRHARPLLGFGLLAIDTRLLNPKKLLIDEPSVVGLKQLGLLLP